MQWSDFKSFSEYLDWFKKLPEISTKVGIFSPNDKTFFSSTFYFFDRFFPTIGKPSINTPVGKATKHRILLDRNLIFAGTDGTVRQGDFFAPDTCFPVLGELAPDFWMVLSHSCCLPKEHFAPVIPIYTSSRLAEIIKSLHEAPNGFDFENFVANIESNKKQRFISFPTFRQLAPGLDAEFLLADLDQIHTMKRKDLVTLKPEISLTFEGLSYFQCRVATRLCRDLKLDNWDDNRVLGHEDPKA